MKLNHQKDDKLMKKLKEDYVMHQKIINLVEILSFSGSPDANAWADFLSSIEDLGDRNKAEITGLWNVKTGTMCFGFMNHSELAIARGIIQDSFADQLPDSWWGFKMKRQANVFGIIVGPFSLGFNKTIPDRLHEQFAQSLERLLQTIGRPMLIVEAIQYQTIVQYLSRTERELAAKYGVTSEDQNELAKHLEELRQGSATTGTFLWNPEIGKIYFSATKPHSTLAAERGLSTVVEGDSGEKDQEILPAGWYGFNTIFVKELVGSPLAVVGSSGCFGRIKRELEGDFEALVEELFKSVIFTPQIVYDLEDLGTVD